MKKKSPLTAGFYVTAAALLFVALLCLWGVWVAWRSGGAGIGLHGWIAMGLAVVLGGGVSAGLMSLAFFSARRGFDDDVAPHDPEA